MLNDFVSAIIRRKELPNLSLKIKKIFRIKKKNLKNSNRKIKSKIALFVESISDATNELRTGCKKIFQKDRCIRLQQITYELSKA